MSSETCEKHDAVMARLFDNEKSIEMKLENIDTKMDTMIEFKNMIHEIIFGNGNPGLKSKVETMGSHITKLWGFVVLLFTAIITAGVAVLMTRGN